MGEFELFKRICGEYEGKFTEEENRITFTARNKIASHYQDGSVHTEKVVVCNLHLKMYENEEKGQWFCLSGEEESYSIIGGFSTTFKEESLRHNLGRYGFKKKTKEQITLFDLI